MANNATSLSGRFPVDETPPEPRVPQQTPTRLYAAAAAAAFALSFAYHQSINITAFYLAWQDRWLLLLSTLILAACSWRLPSRQRASSVGTGSMLTAATALLLFTLAGHYLLLSDYDRSRDEQMASFDAVVFAGGHLVAQLPALWRDHADVLNLGFMYPAEQRVAWISSYLPFNAGIRAMLAQVATPALSGPLMTALGAAALWGCVRRLWPQDKEAATVGLILYAGSAQVLVTGMTSYAMPAHLALNLCWLWLFLRGSLRWDLAALLVGFVAVGLHQPLMHPMFAAPVLFLLVLERRWTRAVLYLAGYGVIGAFWLWWPNVAWQMVQADPAAVQPAGVDFMTRLVQTVVHGDRLGLPNMVSNLLRFIAWQHLLLVPLMLIGARIARNNRIAGALAGGLILTLFAMAVLLPYQGHGFGYRYLHGLIGNAILLAIFGWRSLVESEAIGKWRSLLWRTTIASSIMLLPVQGWMAYAFYAAPAQVSAKLDTIQADYVVIGARDTRDAYDLVYNPPSLDRRPVRLLREALNAEAMRAICASHPSVALVSNAALRPLAEFYRAGSPDADASNARLSPRLIQSGCIIIADPSPTI